MVQKEVGERFAASAGTSAYGVPSVLAQLSCVVKVHHKVSRSVFHPVPNVDSVLVVLHRRADVAPVDKALRTLVQAGFAHRRKALAGSLRLHPSYDKDIRERAREALVALGHPADVRAERLTPEDFRALAERLA
jgi:16S rRNA (adenine1518-N6/adenine1519-N6)-dimethyltransferase